jgi:hypothetical protein
MRDPAARRRRGGSRRVTIEQVFSVAEEGEVVVIEPLQKILNFRQFTCGNRRGRRCQIGYYLAEDFAHRLPVGHRGAHIGKDTRQGLRQPGKIGRILLGCDLDLHPRFAGSRIARR